MIGVEKDNVIFLADSIKNKTLDAIFFACFIVYMQESYTFFSLKQNILI